MQQLEAVQLALEFAAEAGEEGRGVETGEGGEAVDGNGEFHQGSGFGWIPDISCANSGMTGGL